MSNLNVPVSVRAIAFIDTQVPNYQSLVAGVTPGTEVVVLDRDRDAIDQITDILAVRTNIESIHLISHGAPGCLQLGKTGFSLDNLEAYSARLQQWRSALTVDADILIYGCNVASISRAFGKVRQASPYPQVRRGLKPLSQSESRLKPTENNLNKQSSSEDFRYETGVETNGGTGEQARNLDVDVDLEIDGFTFIQRIAQLTNTNVAASKNLTGSAAKGGDWELETSTGKIKTPLVFEPEVLANYEQVLNSFSVATNFGAGPYPVFVDVGDFNGDKIKDLAVTNANAPINGSNPGTSILLANGPGSFGTATQLGKGPNAFAIANFNIDGFDDLVVDNGAGSLSIFLGSKSGLGAPVNLSFDPRIVANYIAVADFNDDKRPDIAVASNRATSVPNTSAVSILLQNLDGTFSAPVSYAVGKQPTSIAVGDFDGGGKQNDLAVTNRNDNTVSILFGNESGVFTNGPTIPVGTGPNSIAVGKFDADNTDDLAVGFNLSNNISVLLQKTPGTFTAAPNLAVSATFLAAGDIDGDGKSDLAVPNGAKGVSVLIGKGNGEFSTPIDFPLGSSANSYQSVVVKDIDGNDRPDIAATSFDDNNVSILLNTLNTVNFGAATYSGTEGTTDTVVNIPVTLTGGTPFSNVVVPIAIDPSSSATQNSDYTLSPTSITFPAGATGAALTQNVAVTIKPDNLPENAETAIINFGTITGGVAGTTKQTTLTIAANGQISYAVAADTASIPEGNSGTTPLTFTVTRSGSTAVASSVNYSLGGTATNVSDYNSIGGTSGATAATGTINFAAGETSKTITLNVLGDGVVEGDETIAVTLSNPVAPGLAPAITAATATTTISNDDTAGFNIAPTSTTATEGGATGSYTVKLKSQPSAPITLSFNTGNQINPISAITFDSTNWNVAQPVTVTATDDTNAEKTHSGTITHTATTTDTNYSSLTIPSVTASITDNDSPGVSIIQSAGSTDIGEGAATDTYKLVLTTAPTAPVTINFDSGSQINSIASLTFTPANWNVAQDVTVSAIDDSLAEGTHSGTINHTAVSTDTNYNGLTISPVTATIADNDTAGVTISPTSTTATEGGATGTYSVQLKSQPTAPVTISFGTGDRISAIGSVTFDSSNWDKAKSVTVTAADDTVVEGNHTGTISHTAASDDAKYNGIVGIPNVAVAITDNDVAPPKPVVDPVIPKPVVEVLPKPVVDPVIPKPVVDPVIPKPVVDPAPPKLVVDPVIPKLVVDPVIPKLVVDPPTRIGGNDTIAGGIDAKNWCGVEAGLDKLEKILDDQLQAVNLPIVGPLKNISPDFISNIKTKLVDAIKNGANQGLSQLENSIRNALGPQYNVALTGNSNADESTLLITLGRQYQFPDINLTKNLGVPALSLDVDGKAQSQFNYNLSLGVGVSKAFGCYIDTDKTKLTANIDLGLDDQFKAKGNLGFFQVDLANDTKNPTKVDANLEVKLNDLDNLGGPNDGERLTLPELQGNYQFKDLFKASLKSDANLGLTAKTSINGNASFPSYNFDLAVNWPILNYDKGQLTGPQKPTVAFNNMQLDLGTFVNNFAKPVIGKISDVIKPFRPVINFLNADTKLLSKLGIAGPFDKNGDGKVSVLELAAKISGRDIDTRFLDAVAKVDKIVDLATQIANSPDKIDLGSYTLGNVDVADNSANLQNASPVPKTALQQTASQQINSKTGGKVKEFLNALQDIDGFDIPLLTKPQTAIQLLIGKPDVPVFTYQMPKLGFDFNIDKKFPIWGPIEGLLEGKFSAAAHLGFGYDTYGLSEWKKSNFASGSASKVLDGFYVSDRENADGTGPDVDELTLDASIAVGAGIDAKIVEGYVKGGIEGKVGIDLIDIGEFQPKQGGDGKIRASEIASRISKPTELFDVTGKVNAFLGAEAKVISVKFCEKTFKIFRKRFTIPYPCGFDYKTVYDNHFATFELASFSLGPSSSTRGRAINGYMTGATVFFDANFNGVKDDSEPFSITNADGSFDLDVSLDKFDKNNNGDLEPAEGRIVLIDGINTSTNLPQQTPLFATPDAIVVTPLTTLLTELVEQGTDQNQAQSQVKSALGLSPAIDLNSYDPLQAITQNDPNGLAVYAAHAQVQNTIVSITDLISGASNTAKNEIADRLISTLANQIKSGTLDLGNQTQLQAIIQSAATQLQVPQVSAIASDAAKIIAEGNQRIGAIASSNSSPSDAATEIARVQLVQQGEVAKDLQQVAAGSKTIQQAIAENTGASLNTQIQSATANNPTVRNTVTDDSTAPSNPEEPGADSGIELVKDGQNFTESTDGDDTLVGSAADDLFRGKKGNDLMFSIDGNDWINGNQGNDLTDGGIGDDTLYGGKGFDTLTGGPGNDFMSGNRGEDILMGEKGEDTLYGGQGNDILVGGQGNDFLSGDLGDDTLVGDVGSDRFLLSNDSGIDTITDFEDGKDLLILGNKVTFSQLAITESNGITQIGLAATGQVFASLIGVSATAINAADFSLL